MQLFLSGGGTGEDSINLDKLFSSSVDKSKPLVYIPIALDERKHPYDECMNFIKNIFNPLGIENIIMLTERNLQLPSNGFDSIGGVYVGGGNTFYLLNKLKETGLFSKLKKSIENGVPFYGGSAGAIICGKSITTTLISDDNNVKLKDYKGMNLVKNFSLSCHYKSTRFSKLKELKNENNLNILALPENNGLFVSEKGIEVIGPGSTYKIEDEEIEIKPHTII